MLAQLTARANIEDVKNQDPFDFTLYGLWAMRTAFEETHEEGVDPTPAVKQAAFWIRYGGPQLRKLCVEGRELDANLGVSQGKYEGRGWRGFNEERWGVWKDEFKAAKGKRIAGEEAAAAVGIMEKQ